MCYAILCYICPVLGLEMFVNNLRVHDQCVLLNLLRNLKTLVRSQIMKSIQVFLDRDFHVLNVDVGCGGCGPGVGWDVPVVSGFSDTSSGVGEGTSSSLIEVRQYCFSLRRSCFSSAFICCSSNFRVFASSFSSNA